MEPNAKDLVKETWRHIKWRIKSGALMSEEVYPEPKIDVDVLASARSYAFSKTLQKIKKYNFSKNLEEYKELLNHPLCAVRLSALESAWNNFDVNLQGKIEEFILNKENDLYIRSLVAAKTQNIACINMLKTHPEKEICYILKMRGYETNYIEHKPEAPKRGSWETWGKEHLKITPPWGEATYAGKHEYSHKQPWIVEATPSRMALLLDDRIPKDLDEETKNTIFAAKKSLKKLQQVTRNKEAYSFEEELDTKPESLAWPAYALHRSGQMELENEPIEDLLALQLLVSEFGMSWTETGNINREMLPQKAMQKALEESLGRGEHERKTYVNMEKPISVPGEHKKDPFEYSLSVAGDLLRLWQKASVEESKQRTGLDRITLTRGLHLTLEEAKKLGLTIQKPTSLGAVKIPDFKSSTLNSASPGPRTSFGLSHDPLKINVIIVYTMKLKQTLGLAGVGFNDEYGGESDCPTGPIPSDASFIVTNIQNLEEEKQLLEALNIEYEQRLALNEPTWGETKQQTNLKIKTGKETNNKNQEILAKNI